MPDNSVQKQKGKANRQALVALALSTIIAIGISLLCLSSSYFIIFQNLFYIPIILACMYYLKRGFVFAVVVAVVYFLLILAFTRDATILLQAFIRVFIFTLIAGVTTYLSLTRQRVEEALQQQRDHLEDLVRQRTSQIEQNSVERQMAEGERLLNSQRIQALLQLSQMNDATLKEITDFALEQAVLLTQSKIGYLAFLNEDESVLTMHSWSKSAMDECAINDKPIVYPVVSTGLWGEAVRQRKAVFTNDYPAANPLKKGVPQGHVALKRHLNTPIFDGSHIVIVAGVGNKNEDYDDDDVRQLTLFMEGMWKLLQRKHAEEELRQSEERLRIITTNTPDHIVCHDRELRYQMVVNPQLGLTEQDMIGKTDYDILAKDDAEKLTAIKRQVLETGEPFHLETSLPNTRGELEYFDGYFIPKFDASGRTDGLVGYFRNVTERKRTEEENLRLRDKAEVSARLAAVGEMAAGIAHEINNPLTGVVGFSELLLDRHDLSPDIREQVRIISQGGHRVKDIVRRMLTFAHQIKPVKAKSSINELIDATLDLRAYVLRTANIEVVKHMDKDLPWIVVDPGQMQQVFLNLIVNAEYAMKKAHGKGTLAITTEKMDGHIRISFRDDGTGMSPETKAKLFHPFFTTKQVNEGTGLGLSLSRSIILEHGGSIEVESEIGKGATFVITLPATQSADEIPVKVVTAPSSRKVKAARILVVDDEESVRSLISVVLARSGHSVDATADAQEALDKLQNTQYDVILMDIRMPGMSGMELYARVMEKYPGISNRFLFITGDTSDVTTMSFLEQNKLPYISKPFDRETLERKVESRLP